MRFKSKRSLDLHTNFACAGMLRQILLLQRDVPKAAKFYQEGLGLPVKVLTERWAELDAGCTTLALKAVEGFVRLSSEFCT